MDFVRLYTIYPLGGCRSVPSVAPTRDRLVRAKSGTATRVHARACRATRFQPLRNKSSEENLPEGINVGVGSPRVFCPPSRIPRGERVKLPLPPRATLIARPWNAMYSQGIDPAQCLWWRSRVLWLGTVIGVKNQIDERGEETTSGIRGEGERLIFERYRGISAREGVGPTF